MSTSVVQQDFFVAGGALEHSAPSYVARAADRELQDALVHGDFCYVLTPRQMGKSSLMVRTAGRLQDAGIAVAVLDLTAIGQNVDLEKWYSGLISALGQQLDIEDELDDFWWDNQQLGPLQRWMAAIRQVVLPRCSRLVVFVDEIDVVRSLPFSTDEFFAGIRSCYNHRSDDPSLRDLTFCLLGVATPSDLIQDTRMTPFNIGRRIELHDFTEEDAAVLADGLSAEDGGSGREMLRRVLYWTGGHPYLTQRLCRSIAKDSDATGPADVDRICGAVFLSQAARQQDSNLLFVQQRILRSDNDLAGLLDEYDSIYRERRVRNDERSELHSTLRLSGIVRTRDGFLEVRNQIYRHVYDRDWIKTNMPDAELRRQRAAFRKGLLRASGVAAVVILLLAAFASMAIYQRQAAQEALHKQMVARRAAEDAEKIAIKARRVAENRRAAALVAQEAEKEAHEDTKRALGERDQALAKLAEKQRILEEREQDLKKAKADADAAASEATQQAARARQAKEQAEIERQRAEENEREAVENAEVARRREQLFGELLILLADHAAEGVRRRALELQEKGQHEEAFDRYVEFADLALGERKGFLALELFDPTHVRDLRSNSVEPVRIAVPAEALYREVLEPAVVLGERLLDMPSSEEIKERLAELYVSRGQVLKQNIDGDWASSLDARQIIFTSYDRAAELQPGGYSHFVERAIARYRLPDGDLAEVLADIQTAIELYPKVPDAGSDSSLLASLTTADRELAQLYHAQGNLLEQLAGGTSLSKRKSLLERAERSHRKASELNPRYSRYPLGIARCLRKQALLGVSDATLRDFLKRAEANLRDVLESDPDLAEVHNELGQVYLLEGRVSEARTSFEAAVRTAEKGGDENSLYAYLCNLANAYSRQPGDEEKLEKAKRAAERAISLRTSAPPVEGHYYRGLAAWHLGQTGEALEAFSQVLRLDPDHVDAILSRAHIVFASNGNGSTTEVVRAREDVRHLLASANLEPAQRAKAHYVNSLDFQRYFRRTVQDSQGSPDEQSLVYSLEELLKAATNSPIYEDHCRSAFQWAANYGWQNSQLQQDFRQLQRQFNELSAR